MTEMNRRQFLATAASLGAVLALPGAVAASTRRVIVAPEHFPQGVASADPAADGFLLWTRRPPVDGSLARRLVVEIAEDPRFEAVVATAGSRLSADADWTCRVLVHGLEPDRTYWYRFIDESGHASRTGRTFTAPAADGARAVRFAFVSCQNVNMGHCTAYRHMLREDAARTPDERIRFVLHLGDFIYEMVFDPADHPDGLQGRPLRKPLPMPGARKVGRYSVPTRLDDYRALYRAYLADPDLQDARAQWPFICVWDNHEFSHGGWQSQQVLDTGTPAQSLKVAANQAWFEYIPARIERSGGARRLDSFSAPAVTDVPLDDIDEHGLSHEPNNLAAIHSLVIHRTLRWGRHVELLLTDNRSFRAQPLVYSEAAAPFQGKAKLPWFAPQEIVHALDAGRTADGGHPSATLRYGDGEVPNPRRDAAPPSMLGMRQKAWLCDTMRASTATWKLWGNSVGMLDRRADLHNLPPPLAAGWPVAGYGMLGPDDWSGYASERGELLEFARTAGVTNLVSLAGDRHAFFAGTLSNALPPAAMQPAGVEFIVGSLVTPTLFQAAASALPAQHPYRGLFAIEGADGRPRPSLNVAVRHGVRSALALGGADLAQAQAARNSEVAPHLAFADLDGHGYALALADEHALEVEFVALPPPLTPDDPEPLYRVTHRVESWRAGESPVLRRIAEHGEQALAERFLDSGWN